MSSRKRPAAASSAPSSGDLGESPTRDYKKAWLAKSPTKKAPFDVPDTVKVWFNACFNPRTMTPTGKWMLFVQPKDKEPDTVVKDIVDSVALDSEVRISKANQYYLTNVKLYSQCKHLIAGLLEANYKINPEIGKEEQFKEFAATKPVVLTVEESILQVKISGDTNMFEHILEAEPINAEKEPYTFPPTFVLPKKDLAHKLPILKAMATFWEIKLNLNGVEVDSA